MHVSMWIRAILQREIGDQEKKPRVRSLRRTEGKKPRALTGKLFSSRRRDLSFNGNHLEE